jgi:hypothetical protein
MGKSTVKSFAVLDGVESIWKFKSNEVHLNGGFFFSSQAKGGVSQPNK